MILQRRRECRAVAIHIWPLETEPIAYSSVESVSDSRKQTLEETILLTVAEGL